MNERKNECIFDCLMIKSKQNAKVNPELYRTTKKIKLMN